MDIITLSEFKCMFRRDLKSMSTLTRFVRTAQVRVGNKIHSLGEYMKKKSIPPNDIEALYSHILDRDAYLTRFYDLSLQIHMDKLRIHGDIIPMKNREMSNNKNIVYKNLIRNMHMKDILQNTKSGIENVPTFLDVLDDLYNNMIIDYKLLTPSARFYINNGRIGSVFSSYYFRASIMNPYLVYSLNKTVLRGTRVFTPTLGWSSYCYGFLECPEVEEYVGTDVIPSVCEKTRGLAKLYSRKPIIDIYCRPSEDLFVDPRFLKKYKEHFDLVFFSPPYYKLELYDSENQSTSRYKDYSEWLDKYWEQTIKLSSYVLEMGGKLCYILSGYGAPSGSEQYNLLEDMNRITKKYFILNSTQPMHNKNVHVSTHRDTDERIMIFTKKRSS